MNLKEFVDYLNKCAEECLNSAHTLEHDITFHVGDDEYELDFNPVLKENFTYAFDINRLGGCGCWNDIDIKLRKVKYVE